MNKFELHKRVFVAALQGTAAHISLLTNEEYPISDDLMKELTLKELTWIVNAAQSIATHAVVALQGAEAFYLKEAAGGNQ